MKDFEHCMNGIDNEERIKWEEYSNLTFDIVKDYTICVGTDNNKKPIKPFQLKSISDMNKNIM